MAGRTPASAIASRERSRGRKYTAKQKKFLKLYAENGFSNSRECAEKAGYRTDKHLEIVNQLKDDILEITKDLLLSRAPEAATAMIDIVSSEKPIPNAQQKLAAAKEVLDRVGVVKPEKVEHEHKVTGGLFLIPTKQELVINTEEYEECEYHLDTEEIQEA